MKHDANAFREGLKAFLENHGYKLDNIYNGDETSLFWKHFPTKTFGEKTIFYECGVISLKPKARDDATRIAKGGIEESDFEEELLNSNNNKDSDEESPNFPPPSLDEVLPSILQICRWSRGSKIVTVEENRSLDSLMEKMVKLKINIL
ncbi:hypothetical protein NQ318_004624 [Aromia moschata]|uniref:Uncharacterized protein n=1 Tax=Aromia moschata TaxID=1265417 RepID=A0AAV8Y5L0_9CUCU|nr:hypothetical protein NQ318_004624 [Aromia moschata]